MRRHLPIPVTQVWLNGCDSLFWIGLDWWWSHHLSHHYVLDRFDSRERSEAMTAITFSQVALWTGYRWTGVRKQGKAAAEFHLVHRSGARAGQRSGMSIPARVCCYVSAISMADARQCSWQCTCLFLCFRSPPVCPFSVSYIQTVCLVTGDMSCTLNYFLFCKKKKSSRQLFFENHVLIR